MMEHNGNGATGNLQFDEEMCERYLFGELTEAEQERFEAAYFGDDVFFDRFVAVKTELMDLYSRGELDAGKRARMEPHFLATAPRRKRLTESSEFIQAVSAVANRGQAPAVAAVLPQPSLFDSIARFFTIPRLASVAALLIALIGGVFLLSRSQQDTETDERLAQQPPVETNRESNIPPPANAAANGSTSVQPELTVNSTDTNKTQPPMVPKSGDPGRPKIKRSAPFRHEEVRPDSDRKYAAVDRTDPNANTIKIIVPDPALDTEPEITLRAGATRAPGEGNTLTIPAGVKSAKISLVFRSEQYSKYIVTITNVAGSEIFRDDDYRSARVREMDDGSRRLDFHLNDTSRMGEKDYIIKVEGHNPGAPPETIEEYYFHVRRVKEERPKKP